MERIYKKENWVLTHNRYINELGFEVDSFDLFDEEKRIHYPFYGKLKVSDKKVSDKDTNFPINRIPYDYTEKDYAEMLDEEVINLTSRKV